MWASLYQGINQQSKQNRYVGSDCRRLAAWTYENDRECFYASLISKDAVLSNLGKTALDAALWSLDRRQNDCIELEIQPPLNPTAYADRLMMLANLACHNENPQALLKSAKEIFYDDKEGMYAGSIIVELIQSLHIGKSKKEALSGHFGNIFAQMKAGWQWKNSKPTDGLLTYLMRAWYCFETAWDFTSAIHNAARWQDVERHIWTHYDSSFENRQFIPEEYRRHIRSSHTGWEYRYGIYLDDGWVYVYRSAVLLAIKFEDSYNLL